MAYGNSEYFQYVVYRNANMSAEVLHLHRLRGAGIKTLQEHP